MWKLLKVGLQACHARVEGDFTSMYPKTFWCWPSLTTGPSRVSCSRGLPTLISSVLSFSRCRNLSAMLSWSKSLEVALQIWPFVQKMPNCMKAIHYSKVHLLALQI